MWNKLTPFISLIESLGRVLKNLYLGLFIYRSGETKEVVREKKKEVKDAKRASRIRNNIKSLDDNTLNNGLRKPNSPKK